MRARAVSEACTYLHNKRRAGARAMAQAAAVVRLIIT